MMRLSDYIRTYGDKTIDPDKLTDVLAAHASVPEYKPNKGETYYTVHGAGDVHQEVWQSHNVLDWSMGRWEQGNVFPTREAAEFEAERRKVKAGLERLARESGPVSWSNRDISKVCLYYDHDDSSVKDTSNNFVQHEGSTYFATGAAAMGAISTIGEERIKKYLFGVDK